MGKSCLTNLIILYHKVSLFSIFISEVDVEIKSTLMFVDDTKTEKLTLQKAKTLSRKTWMG